MKQKGYDIKDLPKNPKELMETLINDPEALQGSPELSIAHRMSVKEYEQLILNSKNEAKNYFTRVLKGHIAIASSKFPVGTNGSQLDALARTPLWAIGADYDHGTGHGVGSYLGVHEGPQRISKLPNSVSLQPGMIVSNEPGYYKSGAYGIRLENLLVVQSEIIPNSERAMLSFETITLAPFDRSMILNELLEDHEKSWLNNYHAWVRKQLLPLLSTNDGAWLIDATEPL